MRLRVTSIACLLALATLAAGGDDKPATPATPFALRVVAFGDTYHGIRFKPATGESWKMLNGVWEKVAEIAAAPAGDYDITIVPAEVLLAVRVDRASGGTWLLQKGKWNPVKEPMADPKAPPPAGPGFAIRHVVVGDHLQVVRFHAKTGATWHVSGDAFKPLAEFDKVPAGEYDLTLIASKKDWMGFRIDRKTGATWILQANIWQRVVEPE
jgi:hypothetical protein